MADLKKKLSTNAPGDFFVDSTCINCDTCRQLAPAVFTEIGDYSAVKRQPLGESELVEATRALLACPTGSIGTVGKNISASVRQQFPLLLADNVYYNGFNSAKSYGGNSYFIVEENGNWLIDSPKFIPQLVERFTAFGGIRYIFLTHRDDVADADKYAEKFGARRIIHELDLDAQPGAEIVLKGLEPVEVEPGFVIVPTPGHTEGHCVLVHRERHLFTGDHLAWDREEKELQAFFRCCWYSWPEQKRSLSLLQNYQFQWVFPGHGERIHLEPVEMRRQLAALVSRLERIDSVENR